MKKNKFKNFFTRLNQSAFSLEYFLEKNKKKVLGFFGIVILVFGFWYGYKFYYKAPLNTEANEVISYPIHYFNEKKFKLALEGDGLRDGFLDMQEKYASSDLISLINFYTGLCYEQLGDKEKSLDFLDKASAAESNLQALILSKKGDILSESKKWSEAYACYKESVDLADKKSYPRQMYLFKAALTAFELQKYKEAEGYFLEYEKTFPKGTFIKKVKQYINRLAFQN